MSLTYSEMMPLGTVAPDFSLPDSVSGKVLSLNELKSSKGTVVMFICNHCPYVVHVQYEIANMAKEYQELGLSFVAISSNDIENYPMDAPELMKIKAEDIGYTFPYLYDESQDVAKSYQAACTPDFYLFDGDLKCIYRGRMDDSSPGNGKPVTGSDLREAMDALLNGDGIPENQLPSMGCNIKWKKS